MVVLAPRFALLAAITSMAAVSILPASVEGVAIHARHRDTEVSSSHSAHAHSPTKTTDDSSSTTTENGTKRLPAPTLALPVKKPSAASKVNSSAGSTKGRDSTKKEKDDIENDKNEKRTWDPLNPLVQLGDIWIGDRSRPSHPHSKRDVVLPPLLNKRHHHHHDNDHHNHEKVIVTGDDDHVNVHRSLFSRIAGRAPSPAPHRHHHGDDRVIVSGDNDHVRVHRSPSPDPHHRYHNDGKVVVSGDNDHVRVHRSPSPAPHHHHHNDGKVIVSGDNDHVRVHRSPSPAPHHHHNGKVVVSGNNDHVRVHRSPSPAPHRHHHYNNGKVVVSGDNDHVKVHEKKEALPSVLISGDRGASFLVSSKSHEGMFVNGNGANVHLKRSLDALELQGVPGSVDIMSAVADSPGSQRIASLVLTPTSDNDTESTAAFVLNASGLNQTQVYLVATPDSGSNSTDSNSTMGDSYLKVALQISMFDAGSAMMKPYCATFDPKPAAPAPLTVEACNAEAQDHKSQVFAYEPETGIVRPMWFEGEDDGTDSDYPSSDVGSGSSNSSTVAPQDPPTPESATLASVTGFENVQDDEFGDATRPPLYAGQAESFATEAAPAVTAQNVTLVFTPAAPVISPHAFEQKVGLSSSALPTATSTSSAAAISTSSATDISASSDMMLSSTLSAADIGSTSASTATDSSSSTMTDATSSATLSSSDVSATATLSSSDVSATSTSTATAVALGVEVYNPNSSSSIEATVVSTSASSTASDSASAQMATSTPTPTDTASTSTMTPVSTAPYEWMFKEGTVNA